MRTRGVAFQGDVEARAVATMAAATASAAPDTADEAMTRYGRGDDGEFEIMYETVAPRLEGYLRRHVGEGSRVRVEDILQQTFENIHRARGSFVPGSRVLPWALTIGKRLMIDAQRKGCHEVARDMRVENDTVGAILVAALDSGEEITQAGELIARLVAAFESLPEMQRLVFDHVKADGLGYAEVGAILGITEDSVRMYLHRGCKALRAAADGEACSPHRRIAHGSVP